MSDSIFLTNGNGTITGLVAGTSYSGDLVIPEYVVEERIVAIGINAFRNYTALTSVIIPNSVTSIGLNAFYNCIGLTSITIPDSVTYIGNQLAFYNTPWLSNKQNENPLVIINNILIDGTTCTGDINIPNNVTSIVSAAFYESSLTSINIPNNVTSIGEHAFRGCTALASINMPNNITNIGGQTFLDCTSLTSINIPNSVTSIGANAFGSCTSLTSITIPDNVTSIGSAAFSNCTTLTSINIPNSVTSIGTNAFYNCQSLTTVYVDDPDNLSLVISSYNWNNTNSGGVTFLKYIKETNINQLIINKLTKEQYQEAKEAGNIVDTELYMTIDEDGEENEVAPLASPAFTGTPTAPTASAGTNTTQIATTAFVNQAIDSSLNTKGNCEMLLFDGLSLTTSSWVADQTYSDYPYKATITLTGVTSATYGEVIFDDVLEEVCSPKALTGMNTLTVYAKEATAGTLSFVAFQAL